MARPLPRFGLSKRVGHLIKFGAAERAAIETEYRHKLTAGQWEEVEGVTSDLTLLVPATNSATPLSTVLAKFRTLQAAAKSLRSEFVEFDDNGTFTPEDIYWGYFAQWRRRPPHDEFALLEAILGAAIKYSEFAIRQMQDPEPKKTNNWRGPSEDEIWNIWINALTNILKAANLPYRVRKDSDKNKASSPSPFVIFIRELQKILPEECRRFTHSDDALAQGISRARSDK